MRVDNPYDEKYAGREYYWGKKPSAMCDRVVELVRPCPGFRPRLLDLGCGEGRNAVYFAKHGFEVVGLDASLPGLEKTRRYAGEMGVRVKMRRRRFQDYKDCTSPGGINALSVFVSKPFIARAPDAEETAFPYKSGELMSYYWDWEILYCTEEIFDCMSSGVPHRHAVNRVIARRYLNPAASGSELDA
jgi:tellurite methyltransferase